MAPSVMLLLACCVLLHLGTSLRLPPLTDATEADDFDYDAEVTVRKKLPNISAFERDWKRAYYSERKKTEPMSDGPDGLKLVLGVFTEANQTEYRKVVRRTWLQQQGVCLYRPGPLDPSCTVYVAFVVGNRIKTPPGANTSSATQLKARVPPGSFGVDVEENTNEGKAFAWFQAASREFPWATHIAKCDIDTYPFLHKLLARMSSRRCVKNDHEFAGQYTGLFNNSCAPRACETNYDAPEQRMQFISRPSEPFVHVGGQFYLMSRRLAQKVARPGSFWEAHRNWPEGHAISRAIDATATEHKFCVFPWLPDSWYHHGEEVGSDFANDF
mmetsp:Transcript_143361/g.348148  ORF Transcript_143361/g.348148 Transcript_143361/m.348148 type:complete len:328 (-) Transcript_143361:81-1064(-)